MKTLKTVFQYLMMLTVLVGFAACGSDDNPDTPDTPQENKVAQAVVGNYDGWIDFSSKYASGMTYLNQRVAVTANSDGSTVSVAYSDSLGTCTLSTVSVTAATNGYNLAGEGKFSMGMAGKVKEYDCTLAGFISTDRKTYTLTFTLPQVMGGTKLVLTNGEAPAVTALKGEYAGWGEFKMKYGTQNYDSLKVAVAVVNDTLTVTHTSTAGSYTVKVSQVTLGQNGYTVSGEGQVMMGMNGNSKAYDCDLEGTISTDRKTYSLVFTIPSVMGGTTFTFANGNAPKEDTK